MKKFIKFFFINASIITAVITTHPAAAEETTNDSDIHAEYTTGIRVYNSSGIAEDNIYYKPFAGVKLQYKDLQVSPLYSRLQNYQITDGAGNYSEIGINKISAVIDYSFTKSFSLSGEYAFSAGDSNYYAQAYSLGFSYDTEHYGISGEYSRTATEYLFGVITSNDITSIYSIEYNKYTSGDGSLDLSADYKTQDFSSLGYTYTLMTGRAGFTNSITADSFYTAGLTMGSDSANYIIPGIDAGLVIKFFGHIKITFMYIGSYSISPSADSASTKKGGAVSPYLQPEISGESYYSHTASIGAALVF